MVTTPQIAIAKELRLTDREIAELAGTSHVVVNRVRNGVTTGMCSQATRERIYGAIEMIKAKKMENLHRLSGGATA